MLNLSFQQILIFDVIFALVVFIIYRLAIRYQIFKNTIIIIYWVAMVVYLVWRLLFTMPHDNIVNLIAGILLYAAEIGGFFLSTVFYLLFAKKHKRPVKTLAEFKDGKYPTVNVFIATYNEDEMILSRIITAAKNMTYPGIHKVYVLDDGHRDEIKVLSEKLGVNYVNRDNNDHAKAGNLNNGLDVTDGELIVTMDADMVPRSDFLLRTIGYFADEEVGFIQSPQTFFNNDPYQFNLFSEGLIANDQDFFMQSIEAQKDAYNATMYVGSNAVFRRKALEDIGGFSTGVITEDMATGMLVQAKGWKTAFVNENLASGLAPETFGDLITQRDRWARGNIQVARKWNPIFTKGLTLMQRIIYMDGIHYWVSGIYKMIYLFAPIVFLLFGVYSLRASLAGIMLFWFPAFITSQLAFNTVSEGRQTIMLTNVYETVMAPYMSFAVMREALFLSKNKFAVTRKGVNTDETYYNWRLAMPVLVILVLSILALIKGILIMFGIVPFKEPVNAVYINVFWLCYNISALALAAFMPFERPRFRKAERFPDNKSVEVYSLDGQKLGAGNLNDWNEIGAAMTLNREIVSNFDQVVSNGSKVIINVEGHSIEGIVSRNQVKDEEVYMAISYVNLSEENYAYIISQTYALASTIYKPIRYNNSISVIFLSLMRNHFKVFQKPKKG
ncbi:glycosyltransferase [Floricoccus penangensis]|uniref:Glycosyltransferase n=1 Tax=Floricoccus penangensis TaxID=1859475 RepID=A0A9Q5P2F3_9LACT|nr:cellulose synthase catalytic subunit [Floricoccus penangensis]OFI48019.1 glycosyltransferase [Floricoccus penangensis]